MGDIEIALNRLENNCIKYGRHGLASDSPDRCRELSEKIGNDHKLVLAQLTAERELSGALREALEEIRDSMESGRIGPATKRNIALSLSEKAIAQYNAHKDGE